MSQGFNAYREWLGVAGESTIPSYYELLGLRPLESDMAQIEAAYQRQAARLAAQLSGPQADVAQRLMAELAEARLTLLTPTAKRAYDAALVGALQGAVSPSSIAVESVPASPQPVAAYPTAPRPVEGQQYAPAYGYAAGYPAPAHAAPVYPAAPAYPGWQPQPGAAYGGPMPGYYPAAQAPVAAPPQAVVEGSSIPTIRPRRARRRSSPVPAVVGVLVVLGVLGGMWLYYKGDKTVTVAEQRPSAAKNGAGTSTPATKPAHSAEAESRHTAPPAMKPEKESPAPRRATPPRAKTDNSANENPAAPSRTGDHADREQPAAGQREKPSRMKPEPEKPAAQSPAPEKPAPEKPAPEKPVTDKPPPEKPKEEPMEEPKAPPEEAATVGTLLKSARAALANRDLAKAKDLLAEATIEATAPDTTAEVGRVQFLADYVEMFWDAVRQTLPKLGLEELEINGTMMAVVEADENHLIVRAEGKNRDFKWKKLPHDIAYYLANRWLAPEDPVRNLVLASFEMVDPKGDRRQAASLLDAGTAGGVNAEPLKEELNVAREK